MNRLAWLTCAFLVVVACKGEAPSPRQLGEPCTADRDCQHGHCMAGSCQAGVLGDPCASDYNCDGAQGLRCSRARCVKHEDAVRAEAEYQSRLLTAELEAQRKEAAAKEARLLQQSGITELPAERPVHPPGPGTRVRIVTTKAKRSAFAACRADERLTGGGCHSDGVVAGSYPSGHGAEDSVGARWNCTNSTMINSDAEITAYALCSPLAPR